MRCAGALLRTDIDTSAGNSLEFRTLRVAFESITKNSKVSLSDLKKYINRTLHI